MAYRLVVTMTRKGKPRVQLKSTGHNGTPLERLHRRQKALEGVPAAIRRLKDGPA